MARRAAACLCAAAALIQGVGALSLQRSEEQPTPGSLIGHQSSDPLIGALKIRRGVEGDRFLDADEQMSSTDPMGGLSFNNLQEVLNKVRESLPSGWRDANKSSIVNVGASYKDVDPIYNLKLEETHPTGYKLIGYECDVKRAKDLKTARPDVTVRETCVTGPSIVRDLKHLNVEHRFSLLKTDIDSVDGPVLDSVLREYKPYVVYSEIMWDFAPPVEFTLVRVEGAFNPFTGGCFGMSIAMADHILRRNGYRLIEAAHANIIAVHEDVAHLFSDRPQDPWFWFQFVKDGLYHSHWMGGGLKHAVQNSPLSLYGQGLGLYKEVQRTDGRDNFEKPPVGIRSMDFHMGRIARRVQNGCKISGKVQYMLAVGDRCCAPQWGPLDGCVCEFPEHAVDVRNHTY